MTVVFKTSPPTAKEIWISVREEGYSRWDEADWARTALVNEGREVRVEGRNGKYYVEIRRPAKKGDNFAGRGLLSPESRA